MPFTGSEAFIEVKDAAKMLNSTFALKFFHDCYYE
jgi:hypothetical protein